MNSSTRLKRGLLRISPQPGAVGRDAVAHLDARGLDDDAAGALERVVAQRRDVVVGQGADLGPSCAVLYWHMGETAMRLRSVAPRTLSGVKSVGVVGVRFTGVPGEAACSGVK